MLVDSFTVQSLPSPLESKPRPSLWPCPSLHPHLPVLIPHLLPYQHFYSPWTPFILAFRAFALAQNDIINKLCLSVPFSPSDFISFLRSNSSERPSLTTLSKGGFPYSQKKKIFKVTEHLSFYLSLFLFPSLALFWSCLEPISPAELWLHEGKNFYPFVHGCVPSI